MDGQELEDGSDTVFRYVLCSICPVKLAKPALTYYVTAGEFHNRASDWLVGTPEVGFLFPAFEDRATNLYGALLYTRNIGESREEFVDAVFHLAAPMPAAQQREAFQGLLTGALGEDCSFDTVLKAFADGGKVQDYAKTAMSWAVAEGFFEGYGDGTLRPGAVLTRAQMAKLLTILDREF